MMICQPWDQNANVPHADPREEADINREIEHDRPTRDESHEVAERTRDEELAAARHRICGSQLRVRETDANVNDAGECKRDVCSAHRRADDESKGYIDVRADVGITPCVR